MSGSSRIAGIPRGIIEQAVALLRDAFRNDGAEGESVHLVCDALEHEWARQVEAPQTVVARQAKRAETKEYQVWKSMKRRCLSHDCRDYPAYGGRGITVCARWATSFEAFLEDMGPLPSPRHTIDRIDSNGHYEIGNCRWATRTEQNQNRRVNRMLTFNGVTLCMTEWARRLNVHVQTVDSRLRMGWSVEDALTKPVAPSHGRGGRKRLDGSKGERAA